MLPVQIETQKVDENKINIQSTEVDVQKDEEEKNSIVEELNLETKNEIDVQKGEENKISEEELNLEINDVESANKENTSENNSSDTIKNKSNDETSRDGDEDEEIDDREIRAVIRKVKILRFLTSKMFVGILVLGWILVII